MSQQTPRDGLRRHPIRAFRVWILHCDTWEPRHSTDVPPSGIALEPAENECFTAGEAQDYLEGFNASPDRPAALWAIRVPLAQRYADLTPGTLIRREEHTSKAPRESLTATCSR